MSNNNGTPPVAGYAGNDYNDWHKHYFGTDWDGSSPMAAKPDWMSTHDYNRGMLHYNYNQGENKINASYENAVGMADAAYSRTASAAAKARNSEMEYAGVLYERIKKYLPLQQKRAGIANMGIAQTGLAQITNDHMNRRGAIQGQYNDVIADAQFTRAKEAGAAEQAKADSMSELNALTMQELMDIYTAEDTEKETERTNAINAFKASITSYDSAESALAGLDALGLEATDPQYTALKTEIEGHFRDKAIEGVIGNLGNYPDETAALTALGYVLDPTNPLYSQYETQIKGHFANKTSAETKQVADRAYTTLYDILSSDATKEEIDKIWNEHAHIIPTMTADQQATLNSLYSVSSMPTKTELAANAISMRDEVDALIAEGASKDKIDTALANWKGEVTEDEYEKYFGEVEKAKKSEEYLLAAAKARGANGINYANEIMLQEGANKYANGDVDAYIQSVEAGDQSIKVTQAVVKNEPNLNPQNVTVKIDGAALEKNSEWLGTVFEYNLKKLGITNMHSNNIPNGTVVMTAKGGSIKCVVRFNNSWYLCDHFEKSEDTYPTYEEYASAVAASAPKPSAPNSTTSAYEQEQREKFNR